jgi:hypothetical protein
LGVVGFSFVPNFASKIIPGTTSFTQVIHTCGRDWHDGNFLLIDGMSRNATGFGLTAVPEP